MQTALSSFIGKGVLNLARCRVGKRARLCCRSRVWTVASPEQGYCNASVPHRPNALFRNGQVGGGGLMPAARFVGVLGSVRKSDGVRDSDGIHSLGEFVFHRTASVAAACTRYIASVFFKGRTSPAVEKCSRFSAARSPSLRIRCFDLPWRWDRLPTIVKRRRSIAGIVTVCRLFLSRQANSALLPRLSKCTFSAHESLRQPEKTLHPRSEVETS